MRRMHLASLYHQTAIVIVESGDLRLMRSKSRRGQGLFVEPHARTPRGTSPPFWFGIKLKRWEWNLVWNGFTFPTFGEYLGRAWPSASFFHSCHHVSIHQFQTIFLSSNWWLGACQWHLRGGNNGCTTASLFFKLCCICVACVWVDPYLSLAFPNWATIVAHTTPKSYLPSIRLNMSEIYWSAPNIYILLVLFCISPPLSARVITTYGKIRISEDGRSTIGEFHACMMHEPAGKACWGGFQ